MGKLATVEEMQQVLAVYLGQEMFGIPIAHIQGVLETLPLTYVPLAPAAVRGVMNLRGRIVTAIDLRTSLGHWEKRNAGPSNPHISVVLDNEGDLYSFLVDRVGDVHTLPLARIEPPPLTMNAAWRRVSSGVFQLQDRIMVILRPAALLNFEGG